jgi:protocatechuate 3,4-dioxygenase beta subunit
MTRGVGCLLLIVAASCHHQPGPVTASAQPSHVALCGADEPGERLVLSGRVLDYTGRPLAKAAVVAYHADHSGLYNPPNPVTRTPRLRNVAITERDGRFEFSTIRPGPYPDLSEPAHVHVAVLAPAHHLRYVTYWFEGDPLITAERRQKLANDAETVLVELRREPDGAWWFTHDIRLRDN